MGKKKKKDRPGNPLYTAVEPFARNPALLWPVVAAAGAGAVLARAFGPDTVRGWLAALAAPLRQPPAAGQPAKPKTKKKKRKNRRAGLTRT